MKKTHYSLLLLTAFFCILNAQPPQLISEMKIVGEPKQEPSELVGKEIRDANGETCAGLIVYTDLKDIRFTSYNGVVKVNSDAGRYFIFLSPDERVVEVYCSGYSPLKIILSEVGIRLKSGQTWSVKITGEKSIPVNFIIFPNGSKLFVDGVETNYGRAPQLKVGKHSIRLEKQGYVTMSDTIDISQDNNLFTYNLREIDIYDPGTSKDDVTLIKATVANFKSSDDIRAYELNQLQQAFKNALEATGKYKVVPLSEAELAAIINQYETGTVEDKNKSLIAGISRKTNHIFKASIGKFGDEWTVSIQKIDVQQRKMDNNAAFIRFEGTQSNLIDQIQIAAQKIAGTYVEESNLWYYVGGAVLLGGGAAVFLGGKKTEELPTGPDGLPLPPTKPN